MSTYPHPLIAREGWPYIAIAVAATLLLYWIGGVIGLVVGVLVTAFVVQFFRDPPRNVPDAPNAVLSPADGRVVSVGVARDPWLERDALRISVFMNVFNVHSNRSPVDGRCATSGTTPARSSTRRSTRRRPRTSATRCT